MSFLKMITVSYINFIVGACQTEAEEAKTHVLEEIKTDNS